MLTVVLATTNLAKSARLRLLCAGLPITLTGGSAMSGAPAVMEDGASHLANAVQKAAAWSRELPVDAGAGGGVALASDGGLVIPALPGWESLLTRRATDRPPGSPPPSDADRARWLLGMLRHNANPDRSAHWTEAIAVARDGALIGAWEATGLRGAMAQDYAAAPDGATGFWVSGLWVSPTGERLWSLTDAELAAAADPWHTLTGPVRDLLSRMAVA